jgi:hypothetical protein
MKTRHLIPLCLAVVLALPGPALAVELDFSGSNIYMKFLAGDRRVASTGAANTPGGSGDTASGTDQGQWTEFELRIKATISRQVEAGVRLQSRSSAGYWTDYGGFGDQDLTPTRANYTKARGAYVLLTPGYRWLDHGLIGASDWGMFDPFTVGKLRYIDRDNVKGFYFKGPVVGGGSWEAARISLPNYLQFNYGQGPACCSTDDSQFNEAVYIGQFKQQLGNARLAVSYQFFNDRQVTPDTAAFDGRGTDTFFKNQVFMLKGDGSVMNGIDLRAAYYHSRSDVDPPAFGEPWGPSPRSSISDGAYKLDADFTALPVPGLTFNLQYFNIAEGYFSNMAARRETDVLLTEGSEAAWYNWGQSIWLGGAATDLQQGPATPLCSVSTGGACLSNPGLAPGANGLIDNSLIDFDESPVESVVGWKGFTVLTRYEIANTPMSLELTHIDYNNNWQNYSPTGSLSNFFALNQDRKTNIYVFKVNHVFQVAGGLETSFKGKLVRDEDTAVATTAADDRETEDNGYAISVGNQLFSHLYGSLSYGQYTRDITLGSVKYENKKDISSLRFSYNLSGFEFGTIAQWIDGRGDPLQTGTQIDLGQYRLKAFAKVIF